MSDDSLPVVISPNNPKNPLRHAKFPKRLRSLVITLVVALVVSATGLLAFQDHLWGVRAEARSAVQALESGNLLAVGESLAANRGQQDFAYYFASKVSPRELGDALAAVAGKNEAEPFKTGFDTHAYELVLTDLAGTLALASFGRENRALPESWASDFALAMTDSAELYGTRTGFFNPTGKLREKQDFANRSNLLLLLSRGYWSTEFLKTTTRYLYDYDRRKLDHAWPSAHPSEEIGYAPAPNGVYLTDGIVALTAALTSNPEASMWAFTEFLPGTKNVEGSNYSLGKFTHFLLFEHRFQESPETGAIGMTATLTALSSAFESAAFMSSTDDSTQPDSSEKEAELRHDISTLKALVKGLGDDGECSWSPIDYGHCVVLAAKVVWQWIQRWGHQVLDLLTLTTIAPFPFTVIGIIAATSNATWYAIDGDFAMAGLSLATAVPGLAFTKIAKAVKAGPAAKKAAANSEVIAKVSGATRDSTPYTGGRVSPSTAVKAQVLKAAPRTKNDEFIDPNTGLAIPQNKNSYDIGHKPGYEMRCIEERGLRLGWTLGQMKAYVDNPDFYQIEDRSSNRSHKHEAKICVI